MSREWGTGVPLVRLKDPKTGKYIDKWQTQVEFNVTLNDGRRVSVPEGFIYDKASIPRAVWFYIAPDDKGIVDAALVHDYLYCVQRINLLWIERKEADDVFLELMERAEMRWDKRRLAYRAVRMFGWMAFNPRAKRKQNPHYVGMPEKQASYKPFAQYRR